MKLLFVISSLRGGGAERVMTVLTNELAKRGHDITLAIMTGSSHFYELHPSINIEYFEFKKNKTLFGKIENRFKMLSFIRSLSRKERPDIIISFIYQMNTNVLLSTVFLGIPVIASEHNTLDRKMSLMEKIHRLYISRLADKLTVLTYHDYDFLGKRLTNKTVMPNPLPFNSLEVYNDNREKIVLAVGSIKRYTHKGFDNLIEIWSSIADNYPDWQLQIAGEFDEKSLRYLKNIESRIGSLNKVLFLGQIKNMTELLNKSSIFVLSSRWEGFPMVLIEAMSQGCTCISYDVVSGPREIINHNIDGIIVSNQNKEQMKKSLKDLMEDHSERKRLSECAIKSINRFSTKEIVDKWERLFVSLKKA